MTTPGFATGAVLLRDGDATFANLRTVVPELAEQYCEHEAAEFARDLADAAKHIRQHEAFHRITNIFAPVVFHEGDPEPEENTEQKEDN